MKTQTALITGASSGIGFELAKLFAGDGTDLMMVSQDEQRLTMAAESIKRQYPDIRVHSLAIDLAQPASPQGIYAYTKEHDIDINILVNNAGIQVYGSFHKVETEAISRLMAVNMNALVALTGLFVRDMCARKSGRILNTASTGAFSPCPLNAVYCASKAFVLHFSEAIAEELKDTGVAVTAFCPGATKTSFAKRADIEHIRLFSGSIMEAANAAREGYKALASGKPVAIAGLSNKLMVSAMGLLPRNWLVKIGEYIMQPK